ncbi:hypothetical protein GCM10025868_05560 [Angustibacter aerolatus]|uniref:Uncharacterized protein n=1 Tax=Angustibacter aerolatus TaxID=1162965 RepID=A0ABQ6JCJ4_9ACTN|nr:hypothetical protein GCM10025868_05560 [Angustibacter aerolatus]
MRSRRRDREGRRTPGPADVPGATHPARRRRQRPEPLELDPTLMDDPPAAHPRPVDVVDTSAEAPDRPDDAPDAPAEAGARTGVKPGHWPLAGEMRTGGAFRPAPVEPAESSGSSGSSESSEPSTSEEPPLPVPGLEAPAETPASAPSTDDVPAQGATAAGVSQRPAEHPDAPPAEGSPRHRGPRSAKGRRASVPSGTTSCSAPSATDRPRPPVRAPREVGWRTVPWVSTPLARCRSRRKLGATPGFRSWLRPDESHVKSARAPFPG